MHSPTVRRDVIVASLEYALQHTRRASVAVTSAGPADGKTLTALNLAIAAAREGRRVILVDADERASGLTRASPRSRPCPA